MNYIALTLVSYFIMVKDRSGRSDLGIINERTGNGYLPNLFGMDYIFNIIIAKIRGYFKKQFLEIHFITKEFLETFVLILLFERNIAY